MRPDGQPAGGRRHSGFLPLRPASTSSGARLARKSTHRQTIPIAQAARLWHDRVFRTPWLPTQNKTAHRTRPPAPSLTRPGDSIASRAATLALGVIRWPLSAHKHMKAPIFLTLFFLATGLVAQGRFVQIWSFRQLFDEADVVLIGSVEEPTKRIGTKVRLEGESMEFDNVITKFKNRATLKGDIQALSWDFNHYWFTVDTKMRINPPSFKHFTEFNKVYLIFLKRNSAGQLVPVSGQKQVTSSFIEIQPDEAMMFEGVVTEILGLHTDP